MEIDLLSSEHNETQRSHLRTALSIFPTETIIAGSGPDPPARDTLPLVFLLSRTIQVYSNALSDRIQNVAIDDEIYGGNGHYKAFLALCSMVDVARAPRVSPAQYKLSPGMFGE